MFLDPWSIAVLGSVALVAVHGVLFLVLYRLSRAQPTEPISSNKSRETLAPVLLQRSAEEAAALKLGGIAPSAASPAAVGPSVTTKGKSAQASQTTTPAPAAAPALEKPRVSLWGRLKGVIGSSEVPAEILERVEEILYTSDLGTATVQRLLGAVEEKLKGSERDNEERIHSALRAEMLAILGDDVPAETVLKSFQLDGSKPLVWLVVGVNGAGKTTTIGKLANILAQSGRKVLVAAGDTFRAAAGEQLKAWSDRAQVEIFSPPGVLEPAAIAFEACQMARQNGFDVVIIDTAGRLHTQKNLMEELKKVKRVLQKQMPEAPHETLLVLDANSGQNALVQAKQFHEALAISGVILSKMDGTAKGGVALSLACEMQLPVRLIGVGEGIGDLKPFQPNEYVNAIL